MASVFIGEHKLLQSRVAIKVLQRRHLDNPAIERRFFNEAKVIAAIKHPNIVEIYDFGRADNGAAFIVMELLEGETLRKRIRRGVIPERKSIIFARQLASALAAAHNEGVIHRDLKPDNVFIIEDEEVELGERIKLLDFGIAKRFQSLGPASEQTATGILVGTPAYMSPEQCKGLGNIDGRSDIYSLGVVLYRMITNQLPFEAGGTGELIGKHLYIQPPSPRELNPEISLTLEDIVLRCLQKEPEDRFASMSDLVSAFADANSETAIDPVSLDEDRDTLSNAVPTPSGERLGRSVGPPMVVAAAAPSQIHRVASPVAIEEISATTLRTATGEKISPLAEISLTSRRRWGLYAAVGCAAALLIGIVAMAAGSGSTKSGAPTAASPNAISSDPGDRDDEATKPVAGDDNGDETDETDDSAAAAAAEAAEKAALREKEEAERARLEAEEAGRVRQEQDRLAKDAAARAEADKRAQRELEKKKKQAELDKKKKQAELRRQAEAERRKKAAAEAAERKKKQIEADRKRRAEAAAERRRKEREREEAKKKKKPIDIVY